MVKQRADHNRLGWRLCGTAGRERAAQQVDSHVGRCDGLNKVFKFYQPQT